jgi:hypothetical protein
LRIQAPDLLDAPDVRLQRDGFSTAASMAATASSALSRLPE